MHFKKSEFHHALIMNNNPLDQYLLICLRAALDSGPSSQTRLWLFELFAQIKNILTENSSLPLLKVSCAKFLIYLFSIGDTETLHMIQTNIYPLIKSHATIDRHLPINQRGQKLFTSHPEYERSNEVGRQMMRILGKEYVRFFLETVPVWANELPTDLEVETRESVYYLGYQELRKMGVEFPREDEYVIFTKQNNAMRQNRIKLLIDKLQANGSMLNKNSSLISQRERLRRRKSDSMLLRTLSKISPPQPLIQNTSPTMRNLPVVQQKIHYQNRVLNRQPSEIRSVSPPPTVTMISKGVLTTTIPSTQPDQINSVIAENVLEGGLSKILSNRSKQSDTRNQARPLNNFPQKAQFNATNNFLGSPLGSQNSLQVPSSSSTELEKMYQTRIMQISHSHKMQLQQTVTSLRVKHSQQLSQYKSIYEQLKQQNVSLKAEISEKNIKLSQYMNVIKSLSQQKNRLIAENQQLIQLRSKSIQTSSQHLKREINRLKLENFELKKTFLSECVEYEEFHTEELKENKDRIVNFNSQGVLYIDSIMKLSQQDLIRFKKCILKPKGILFRNNHLEIGCITTFQELNIVKVKLCITNTSSHQIHSFNLQLQDENSIQDIQFIQRQNPLTTLPSKYQQQLTYICKIKHKDFHVPQLSISYVVEGLPTNLLLLFPTTKYKLLQPIPHPHKSWYRQESIQRVIPINLLLLPSLEKLKQIFPTIYDGKQSYILPAMYLNEQYEFQWKPIDKKNIRLKIVYEKGNEDNAYQLMEQFVFLLGIQ